MYFLILSGIQAIKFSNGSGDIFDHAHFDSQTLRLNVARLTRFCLSVIFLCQNSSSNAYFLSH